MTSSRPAMINHNKGAEHHGNRSNRNLNDQAHAIFSENSIHELINLDRESALERLKYFYGPEIDTEKVTKYLAIVERVRIGICDA